MWRRTINSRYGLPENRISQLFAFMDLLLAANEELNLTAARDKEELLNHHILDSLVLLENPEVATAATAVDIGSGGGFPGLPLAIAKPDLRITLLESSRKKSSFLERTASTLGLDNITVSNMRAEDAGEKAMRDSFDLALARAVASLPVVIEYAMPLVRPGGFAVLQRGKREAGDLEDARAACASLASRLDRVEPVRPYPDAMNLYLWIIEKLADTPPAFPRRAGAAKKRPISAK